MKPPTGRDAASRGRRAPGLLGDTPDRSYADKLDLFHRFAEPELRPLVEAWVPADDARVLDAGCGAGAATGWLATAAPEGVVVGVDLSWEHVRRALDGTGDVTPRRPGIVQADFTKPPFRSRAFDLVWCANTLNHFRDPVAGARALAGLLPPGGRLAVGQSAFLPDMFFAWDARLEREVTRACHAFYRDRYGLGGRDTTAGRRLVGILKLAGLREVTARTIVIERTPPLSDVEERYFVEAVFQGVWGERLRPYLTEADYKEVTRLCDPGSDAFCLRRDDFHHVQTFTVVTGEDRLKSQAVGWASWPSAVTPCAGSGPLPRRPR